MGWEPAKTARDPFLILSTQGGLRSDDGRPLALGYHTGHWEVGQLVGATSKAVSSLNPAAIVWAMAAYAWGSLVEDRRVQSPLTTGDRDHEFEFGLAAMIAGLEHLLRQPPTSPVRRPPQRR